MAVSGLSETPSHPTANVRSSPCNGLRSIGSRAGERPAGFEANDIVGESIVWSPAEAALYWVDIVGSRIHRLDPETGAHQIWPTPEYPTSIGLGHDGGFIVGLRQRVCLWTPGAAFRTLAVPEPDIPGNRLNEGVVGPDGAFWVGTMQENIAPDGSPQAMTADTGALYRITADGAVRRLTPPMFGITNTMIWTDDGHFITADTLKNELYAYDWQAGAGTISNRRPFGRPLARGLPDGSTRDAQGAIYNARVAGGAAIATIDASGAATAFRDLPCRSPTSCAFGGRDLRTLYVTSSRFGLLPAEVSAFEGAVFAIDDMPVGKAANLFGQ